MAEDFQRLIAQFGCEGDGYPEWGSAADGSRSTNARLALRQSISRSLPRLTVQDLSQLTDLSRPPRPERWSVSVSHTRDFGGWLAIQRPHRIGWDVELAERIKPEIIGRVCTREEITSAPNPSFLWSSKEAYFKSLEQDQPLGINQLGVMNWRVFGHGLWRWTGVEGLHRADGILVSTGRWIFAACRIQGGDPK